MSAFEITRRIDSPIDEVWRVAGDFGRAPGPGVTVEVESPGEAGPQGVGAIRTITIGKVKVRERLEAVDAPRSFSYRILSGAPMRDHLARAEFLAQGGATEIRWAVEFTPKIPGTGWIVASVTKKAVNRYIDEVEKATR